MIPWETSSNKQHGVCSMSSSKVKKNYSENVHLAFDCFLNAPTQTSNANSTRLEDQNALDSPRAVVAGTSESSGSLEAVPGNRSPDP